MGTDLFMVDMQRGRDHGIGPYHNYYTKCTGKSVTGWNDLRDHFSAENLLLLSKIYESVFDLDLVVGVMLEKKDQTDYLGAVGICLMGEQFFRTKHGDRLFYAFAHSPTQINEIKSVTMAKIFCLTTNLTAVPQGAFAVENDGNPSVLCKDIDTFDYSLWN